MRDILTQKASVTVAQKTKEVMRGYYDFRLFPKKYEDMPTTIRLWNDNIALVTFDEPESCTLITNPHLAQTFKIMFETIWNTGKQI